jgi:hypothetical protein
MIIVIVIGVYIVIYPMRINYSYSSKGLHEDEELNVDASRFF